MNRRRAVGAEVTAHGVHFRVWAPDRERVAAVIDGRDFPLAREEDGYFSALIADARDGTLYRFRLDGSRETFPDPASRSQPEGPHGPSCVVDPSAYRWRDAHWRGVQRKGLVVYELHAGTFTREGTFAAASHHLAELADIGVNLIELMPVHDFAGTFGWGYDGVDLWAPTRLYGEPDDLRRFVDDAHAHGIGVVLDVVYNHFGPDGCYLREFARQYFTDRYENEWGEAINFDGEGADGVRELFAENAAHWIDEYHFDGLRLDATQSIHDASETHILRTISDRARAAAGNRSVVFIAENEPQDARLMREYGIDLMWNDDWHHAAIVAATGRIEAYYSDYRGRPQEFVSMAKHGFLYQGQHYKWQRKRRGTPADDIDPERFVCFLQNHDQVANSARGERVSHPALTALMLLQPQTPMLFQGQEFGAVTPFFYFADHKPELAQLVAEGRRAFMAQFPSIDPSSLAPPHERATFEACQLDRTHRDDRMIRELLALRREAPFSAQRNDWLHGSILGEQCLALRWLTGGANDRVLIVNTGAALHYDPVAEPLLAPPAGFGRWEAQWCSEAMTFEEWTIAADAAIVLRPASA